MALLTPSEIATEAFYTNFDTADIKSRFIDLVEDNTIKPILGETLYNAVVGGSPTAAQITLRDTYVKPLLAYGVKSLVLANNSPRINNVGASYASTPNATSDDQAREMAHKQNETLIQQLKQRLLTYLRDNASVFDWTEQNDNDFITNNIFIV